MIALNENSSQDKNSQIRLHCDQNKCSPPAGGGTAPAGGSTSGCHVLQAVAPPQPEVQPPATLPFLTQARAGGETDPNSLPSLLYSSKAPQSPFLPSKHPNYLSFQSKTSTILPSLEDLTKVFSKKPLNSVFFHLLLLITTLLKQQ